MPNDIKRPLVVIILAAGEGKRMNSDLPKVLHKVQGTPMIERVVRTCSSVAPDRIIVVTGKHHDRISAALADIPEVQYIRQTVPMGTGHAVNTCLPFLGQFDRVLIVNGDMPLVTSELLAELNQTSATGPAIVVGSLEQPHGYGRVVLKKEDNRFVQKIVEQADCTEEETAIQEVNAGIYFFPAEVLRSTIPMLKRKNPQSEYYLTSIVEKSPVPVRAHCLNAKESYQIRGVNTADELEEVQQILIDVPVPVPVPVPPPPSPANDPVPIPLPLALEPQFTLYCSAPNTFDMIENFSFGSSMTINHSCNVFEDETKPQTPCGRLSIAGTIYDIHDPQPDDTYCCLFKNTLLLTGKGTISYQTATHLVKDSNGNFVLPAGTTLVDPIVGGSMQFARIENGHVDSSIGSDRILRIYFS